MNTRNSKGFSYEVSDDKSLKDALYRIESTCKESSKPTLFTLSRIAYTKAATCYQNFSASIEESEACVAGALKPLQEYDAEYKKIWKFGLSKLTKKVRNMKIRNTRKLSKRVNRFANETFNCMSKLDMKFKTMFV